MYHYSYSRLPLHVCAPSGPDSRRCQKTIRKVGFVVFPLQPESESTRNLLRKAVVIGHKTSFVRSRSLRKVAEITPCSEFKSSTKRGYSRFEVYQMSHTQNAPYYFLYTYSNFVKLNFFVVFDFFNSYFGCAFVIGECL